MTAEGKIHLDRLVQSAGQIESRINEFTREHFHCRGGRQGSGMGTVMEALWGFYARQVLNDIAPSTYEIAWITDHAYNDFALTDARTKWDPRTREGEFMRIEAKSMNIGAVEPKGHFDALEDEIGEDDLLLVLAWRWSILERDIVFPRVWGTYCGFAQEVARLRDALHVARGGSFIGAGSCPDHPGQATCVHVGEPVNSKGNRERRSGPEATRGVSISFQGNFGGLTRMLKVSGQEAREVLQAQLSYPSRAVYLEFAASFPGLGLVDPDSLT